MKVQDGTGHGYLAKVTKRNELVVNALQQSILHEISETTGKAFYFATQDFVSLTSDTEQAIFFVQNNDTNPLFIVQIRTCGEGSQKWRMYKNPTSMSNATSVPPISLNYGSSVQFTGTVERGSNTSSLTGGEVHSQWINNMGHSTESLFNALALQPGDSLGLTVVMPTNGDVCVNILGYIAES